MHRIGTFCADERLPESALIKNAKADPVVGQAIAWQSQLLPLLRHERTTYSQTLKHVARKAYSGCYALLNILMSPAGQGR